MSNQTTLSRTAIMLEETLSAEALDLYTLLDDIATDEWQPLSDPSPGSTTRVLLHELGAHRLIASYTTPETNIHWFSRWQNRYPAETIESALFCTEAVAKFIENYGEWQAFSFDHFGFVLRQIGIQTEALFQINSALLRAIKLGIVETQRYGTQIRATDDVIQWLSTSSCRHTTHSM